MKKNGAGQKRTGSATLAAGPITSGIGFYLKQSQYRRRRSNFKRVAEPVEQKLFWNLEPEPKINFDKHFLQSVLRMLG